MSRFSEYFKRNYPFFKYDVLQGDYENAVKTYVMAQHHRVEGKKDQTDQDQIFTAAFDGFYRNGSRRLKDLKEWIDNDEAFEGFYNYFSDLYGKEGLYRVSNKKVTHRVNIDDYDYYDDPFYPEVIKFKEDLDYFLKRLLKHRYYDKKMAFEKTKMYIQKVIFLPWIQKYIDDTKKDLEKEKAYIEENIRFGLNDHYLFYKFNNISNFFKWYVGVYEFIDKIMKRCFWDYLCWYSVRTINRKKIPGAKIPTNKLVKAVKRDLYAYKFMDFAEKKAVLRLFRYQKSLSCTELDIAEKLYNSILDSHDPEFGSDDFYFLEIRGRWEFKLPATLEKAQEIYSYWRKALAFLESVSVRGLDKRYRDAVKLILTLRTPFQLITPQQKKFISALSDVDTENKKLFIKTIDRLIGIFSFCTRLRFMGRGVYYFGYFYSVIPNGKLEFWEEWQKKEFEIFILLKNDKVLYNFRTKRFIKYVSYIDAVKKLYPMDKYQYIKVDYMNQDLSSSDSYYTKDGYTLARYDCSGNLRMGAEMGNLVRKK